MFATRRRKRATLNFVRMTTSYGRRSIAEASVRKITFWERNSSSLGAHVRSPLINRPWKTTLHCADDVVVGGTANYTREQHIARACNNKMESVGFRENALAARDVIKIYVD